MTSNKTLTGKFWILALGMLFAFLPASAQIDIGTVGDISIGTVGSDCGKNNLSVDHDFAPTQITAADCDEAEEILIDTIMNNLSDWGIDCPEEDCNGLGGCDAVVKDITDWTRSYNSTTGKCELNGGSDGDIKIKYRCKDCGDAIVVIAVDVVRGKGGLDAYDGGKMAGSLNEELRVYPNPCQGYLHVNLQAGRSLNDLNLQILNMAGQVVYSQTYGDREDGNLLVGIDVHKFEAGNYLMQLQSGNGWNGNAQFVVNE